MRALIDGESLGYGEAAVLKDVKFALEPGERVVLLGRSGVGKTTLLTEVHNRLVAAGTRVALIPQETGLVPQLDVLRNVRIGRLDDHGALRNLADLVWPRTALRAEIGSILSQLQLDGMAGATVERISGGQRSRTALARALYRGGAVAIGDEPVSAVDEKQAAALLGLLAERFETCLLALHDIDLALEFGTRIVGIARGRIVLDAPAAAVDRKRIGALYDG